MTVHRELSYTLGFKFYNEFVKRLLYLKKSDSDLNQNARRLYGEPTNQLNHEQIIPPCHALRSSAFVGTT